MMKNIDGIYVLETDTLFSVWIAENGLIHDKYIQGKLNPYVKPGDVVLDVGGCYGTMAAMFSLFTGTGGKVHTFEPNKPVFECLFENMKKYSNVKCYNVGCSDTDGAAGIAHNPENPGASFLTNDGDIPLVRLDNLKLRPNFIKIDVEGREPAVLEGARHTIKEHKPVMFIEVNRGALARQGFTPEDIYNKLITFGYSYRNITDGEGLTGEQFDIICTPIN